MSSDYTTGQIVASPSLKTRRMLLQSAGKDLFLALGQTEMDFRLWFGVRAVNHILKYEIRRVGGIGKTTALGIWRKKSRPRVQS